LLDLLAIEGAWLLANVLRFEGLPSPNNWPVFVTGLWLLPVVVLPVLSLAGVYRHPVRHFALTDALRLFMASAFGWALAYLILVGILHRNASFFLAPSGFLAGLAVMGAVRVWRREWWRRHQRAEPHETYSRIAVYGAGRRGNALVSFLDNGFKYADVVGFLDDDDSFFRGRVILGHKVLGSERDLSTIQSVYGLDQLWLSFNPDTHKLRRLDRWCRGNGVKLVILPATPPFNALCYPFAGEEVSASTSDAAAVVPVSAKGKAVGDRAVA
jgi:FlaA1/EpsC-like NDP-sugar epimerase